MVAIDRYLYLGWNPEPHLDHVYVDARGRLPKWFSIAFAADFHIRDSTPDEYIENVCGLLKADMLLLGGDYGESKEAARRLFRAFRRETFPCGAFAVVGNNDREVFPDLDELREIAGMPLLVNESARVSIDGCALAVGGVDEMKHGMPDARGLFPRDARADYSILLSHYPVVPDFGSGARADLILSGHTHGGQVNLCGLTTYSFGFGRRKPRHLAGLAEYDGVKLLVSTGIGMSKLPIRLGCRPRVHLLEFT